MRRLHLSVALLLPLLTALPPAAAQEEHLGAHQLKGTTDFQRVIDTRCTVCHTRERIDIAIGRGRSLEDIRRRMIERGAVLTEEDREVLGTFWGSPLKDRKRPPAAE